MLRNVRVLPCRCVQATVASLGFLALVQGGSRETYTARTGPWPGEPTMRLLIADRHPSWIQKSHGLTSEGKGEIRSKTC
ncbi:hypothetical protein B0J18DRAFT_164064 [Chaetomium sp. MPI-SDFR-AT-0129]|nr:hypothetical protein B0J18DRAFT_164064 [Chaetomium sp. MPI-SDFR-AT-0129]